MIPTHPLVADTVHRPLHFDFMWWGKKDNPYDVCTPHRHDYNEIVVFFKGGGTHQIDFVNYPIADYSLHFVKGGQVHIIYRDADSSGCSVLFTNEFTHRFPVVHSGLLAELPYYQAGQSPILCLTLAEFATIDTLLQQIRAEFACQNVDKYDLVAAYLYVLLLQAKRHYHEQHHPTDNAGISTTTREYAVKQFQALLEQHFADHWTMAQYAQQLCLTPNYLNELCKRSIGKTASALLQERLLLEAKRLLAYTSQSVKEIAYTLNFDDPAYFNRFFKQHITQTPAEFRKAIE